MRQPRRSFPIGLRQVYKQPVELCVLEGEVRILWSGGTRPVEETVTCVNCGAKYARDSPVEMID